MSALFSIYCVPCSEFFFFVFIIFLSFFFFPSISSFFSKEWRRMGETDLTGTLLTDKAGSNPVCCPIRP